MSIKEDAIREMRAANFDECDIEAMSQILTIFFNHWDSGGAVSVIHDEVNCFS